MCVEEIIYSARYGKRAIVVPTAKTAKKSAIPSVSTKKSGDARAVCASPGLYAVLLCHRLSASLTACSIGSTLRSLCVAWRIHWLGVSRPKV